MSVEINSAGDVMKYKYSEMYMLLATYFSPLVQEKAVDPKTRLLLYKMVNSGLLETITGCISTGKESVVFHANGGRYDFFISLWLFVKLGTTAEHQEIWTTLVANFYFCLPPLSDMVQTNKPV